MNGVLSQGPRRDPVYFQHMPFHSGKKMGKLRGYLKRPARRSGVTHIPEFQQHFSKKTITSEKDIQRINHPMKKNTVSSKKHSMQRQTEEISNNQFTTEPSPQKQNFFTSQQEVLSSQLQCSMEKRSSWNALLRALFRCGMHIVWWWNDDGSVDCVAAAWGFSSPIGMLKNATTFLLAQRRLEAFVNFS